MNNHVHDLFESLLNRFSGVTPVLPEMSVSLTAKVVSSVHPMVLTRESGAVLAPNSPGELQAATFIGRTLTGGESGRGGSCCPGNGKTKRQERGAGAIPAAF